MGDHRVQIYCAECAGWLPVEDGAEWVECDCGATYLLTESEDAPTIEG